MSRTNTRACDADAPALTHIGATHAITRIAHTPHTQRQTHARASIRIYHGYHGTHTHTHTHAPHPTHHTTPHDTYTPQTIVHTNNKNTCAARAVTCIQARVQTCTRRSRTRGACTQKHTGAYALARLHTRRTHAQAQPRPRLRTYASARARAYALAGAESYTFRARKGAPYLGAPRLTACAAVRLYPIKALPSPNATAC